MVSGTVKAPPSSLITLAINQSTPLRRAVVIGTPMSLLSDRISFQIAGIRLMKAKKSAFWYIYQSHPVR